MYGHALMQTELKIADVDNRDPCHHTQMMQQRLLQMIDHLREDIDKVDEPHFEAMFETSAEVLGGLIKAFTSRGPKVLGAGKSDFPLRGELAADRLPPLVREQTITGHRRVATVDVRLLAVTKGAERRLSAPKNHCSAKIGKWATSGRRPTG